MKLLKQILQRITEPTPDFFKKIRMIGVYIGAAIATIKVAKEMGLPVPDFLYSMVNGYTTLIALMTVFGSSLASGVRGLNGQVDPDKVEEVKQQKIEQAKRMYDR